MILKNEYFLSLVCLLDRQSLILVVNSEESYKSWKKVEVFDHGGVRVQKEDGGTLNLLLDSPKWGLSVLKDKFE